MRIARGPRPWPIWLFASATTYIAVNRLIGSLGNLNATMFDFRNMFTFVEWNRDLAIIAICAWFTIDMIPVILVLAFAASFARWFISVIAFVPLALILANLEYASTYPRMLLPSLMLAFIPLALAALLWTTRASRYFAQGGADGAETA
ncbi:hypothetical protein [uncultured Erythrobacter sp.]|uniref:hypothetical protein n=1 Tax=uncultured Erythrobacter sp. TaxID=263913 RepID=UPI00261DFBBA|nr:hypothetical protein [uncultured Erythrobacter sp.]